MSDDERSDPPPPETIVEPPQISFKGLGLAARTVKALDDMAYRGVPLPHAADAHNIRRDNLSRSFNSPQVRAVYNQIVKSIREGAAVQAYLRNVELAHTASSENVRLEANKWIAGVDGIAALKRVEGRMHHQHSFGGFDYSTATTIDGHATDTPSDGDDAQAIDDDE